MASNSEPSSPNTPDPTSPGISSPSNALSPGAAGTPTEKPPRTAYVNQPERNKFEGVDNSISTTKYNMLSFVPMTLFAQFRRVANLYFLIVAMLMFIGTTHPNYWVSPISYESSLGPLVFVLLATMVRKILKYLFAFTFIHIYLWIFFLI